jgi:transaldolase
MTSKLEQLRAMTTVVADTGDIEAVARIKPVDCTTNPSIVLKALGTDMFADAFEEAIKWGKAKGGASDAVTEAVADRLAISVGAALAKLVPGRFPPRLTPTCRLIRRHR